MEAVVVEKKANFYLTIVISRNARGWNFTLGKLSVVHCSPKWTIKVCLFLYFEKSPFWSDRKVSEYFVFQVYLILPLIKYTTNIRRKYSRSAEREGNSLWLNHPRVHLHHYHSRIFSLLIWSTINVYKSSFFTSPVLPRVFLNALIGHWLDWLPYSYSDLVTVISLFCTFSMTIICGLS